jgi:hypothetical protein
VFTRRRFIGSALAAGAVTSGSVQSASSQSLRKRLLVDAQIHLWKAESEDWKWIPGMKPQLPEPFTVERALPLLDEAGVDRAVVVPPSWHGDRNDYALEAVRRYPNRFAVMGRIPLQNPKSAELLTGWKQQPGMLGVRLPSSGLRRNGSMMGPRIGFGWRPKKPAYRPCSSRQGELPSWVASPSAIRSLRSSSTIWA